MRGYGSSRSCLRAERMLRLPTHSHDPRLNHDSRACRNAHLLDACSRLNADDYVVLCRPVLKRLTAAKLVSGMSTAAAARGS